MAYDTDVFGKGLKAHFDGNPLVEYVERDDGFVASSTGIPSYFEEFNDWSKIQQRAIQYAHGTVLDVGTAAGRVALYLQKSGVEVISIDNSPLAIEVCKKRGVQDARVMTFEDVGDLAPGSIDTIVMFGSNFSLFGNPTKAKTLLSMLHNITSDGAILLTETNNPYVTDNPIHVAYQQKNIENGKMAGEIYIRLQYDSLVGDWFEYFIVSPEEMTDLVKDTGWKIKEFIKSDDSFYIGVIEKK